MQLDRLRTALVLVLAALQLTACTQPTAEAAADAPLALAPIEGSDLVRITLSAEAAARLDIQTEPVGDEPATEAGAQRTSVPFAAVVYDQHGDTWVYTRLEPSVFLRHAISVVRIEDGVAVLSDGPASGTLVVTAGAAELYGAETGVGGGH